VETLKQANLGLRFLFELCALVALGYWGFRTDWGTAAKIGLGIGAPLLMAVVWGAFVAPKARVTLPATAREFLGLAILELAAVALAAAGAPALAIAFGILVLVNAVLKVVWNQ
jgi:hypothetical protein